MNLDELLDVLDRTDPEERPGAKHAARGELRDARTSAQAQVAFYSMVARMYALTGRYLQSGWKLSYEKFLEWIETQMVVDASDILYSTIHNGIDREKLLAAANSAATSVFGSSIAGSLQAYLTPCSGSQQVMYFRRTDLPAESADG